MNKMRSVKPGTKKEYLQLNAVQFSRKYFPGLTESIRVFQNIRKLKERGNRSNGNRTTILFSFHFNCLIRLRSLTGNFESKYFFNELLKKFENKFLQSHILLLYVSSLVYNA